jgi:hypothetical protein
MGSDDFHKRHKASRKERKHDFRKPKANSFLIVTEGEKTEPLYFQAIQKQIEEKIGGHIDIEICGEGCSTLALVCKADEYVNKAKISYQNVWLVFDKDDFLDFDEAIIEAKKRGYEVAWSNQCFEYWLCLHFEYCDADLHRDDWFNKLSGYFKKYKINNGKYEKNYSEFYKEMEKLGNVNRAVSNAKCRMSNFVLDKCNPSACRPATTVHLLVEKLMLYLNE